MTEFNFGAMISQENQVKQIPVEQLIPYHNHQYTLYEEERRDDMVESIREHGVMTPIICRPHPDEDKVGMYEILIGHNRWNCSRLAGLEYVPGIIKENLSEEDAQTYVDESNLLQRGFNELKISEQARVISRRYFEMFSQGKRNDIINEIRMLSGDAPLEKKPNSREKVGEEYGLSRNTIARLVRISKLIDNIKPWIDSKSISVRAGVELSYLDEDAQSLLYDFNSNEDGTMKYKISEAQAKDLRILYDDCKKVEDKFNTTMISRVLVVKKKKPDKKISVKPDTYLKYFKDKNADEVQEILEQALQQYFNF